MSQSSKACALILDEMSIKESVSYDRHRDEVEGYEDFGNLGRTRFIANHAIVFLVRGMCEKWKQPLGYFLTSGTMSGSIMGTLLKDCITKVEACGLSVKVVISDQGSNNQNMFQTVLGATVDSPHFEHNGHRVYTLYDPPHLLKSVRNNLKNKGFCYDGDLLQWQHIRKFSEADAKLPIRMAPKLTPKHINVPPFAHLSVKLATQVLSHSVAAGITTMVSLGALPKEAQHTANFVERMDRLFNSFNSKTSTSSTAMRHAISDRSQHFPFLVECRDWLADLMPLGGRQLPCIKGWQMAINCLLQLWPELRDDYGFSFLLTNRLNQDCVENVFSVIRGKGGQRDRPDPQQFRTAFRQVFVIEHVKSISIILVDSQIINHI